MTDSAYVFGSEDVEIARLQTQAALLAEPTAFLLQRGGIRPGMRVLDLGSGPGDVAFQVAQMVGPDGRVVGVERDAAQLTAANQRRDQLGWDNVEFREGDVRSFVDEEPFDAVVCRLLLMHLPDAVDVLAHQRRNLRSDGVVVAIDYDGGGMRTLPEVELYSRMVQWLRAGFAHARADLDTGMRLPVLFDQAGYRDVNTLGFQLYWPPRTPQVVAYLTSVVCAIKAAIVASGVTTEAEMDLDTLAERLGQEIDAANAVVTLPTVVGGWAKRP
ncbi:class I SAM-dependent methyltransferase [Mycobacterium sp. NPDC048908]|uniref:class I SAM-dependent methyltransferase n=1 Tax=Mycobacterium sp. NPDC048908 TaxID=3364292 RepID=UPI0037154510